MKLVDFQAFLRSLDRKASVLKTDIERSEGVVLDVTLEKELETTFEICHNETHGDKVPPSKDLMNKVRRVLQKRGIKHIFSTGIEIFHWFPAF